MSKDLRIVVVGGHTRNIGKSALVEDILRAFPNFAWTAMKITQYGHGQCSQDGHSCHCAPDQHSIAIDEETSPAFNTDSARFLAAGARQSYWVRVREGMLAEAVPQIRSILQKSDYAIVESNSILRFLRPHMFVMVVDPSKADCKDSSLRFLHQADAFVLRGMCAADSALFRDGKLLPQALASGKCYRQERSELLPAALRGLIAERLSRPGGMFGEARQ